MGTSKRTAAQTASTTARAAKLTVANEARPLSAAELEKSQEQFKAGEKIWQLVDRLAELANDTSKPPAGRSAARSTHRFPLEEILPQLDLARTNQVLLIDGTRGAGKTTLLVTLVQFWCNLMCGKPAAVPFERDAPGSVIPLDILDMSPLPVSTNLLVMLASGFQRTIKWLSEQPYHAQPLPSEGRWRDFLEVAGSAWDGNLTERRRELDADSYVAELETVELHRLELRSRFSSLIDTLTDDMQKAIAPDGPKPIWLVPIDDADMNPGRAVELLEMLRSLHHPRVVFLLTGESGLFLDKLRAHYLGVLARPLQGFDIKLPFIEEGRGDTQDGKHTYCYSGLGENLYERARRLAQDVYLKIIPPGHRCEISELDPSTRRKLMDPALSEIHFHVDPVIEKGRGSEPDKIKLSDFFALFNQSGSALPSRFRTVNVLKEEIRQLTKEILDYKKPEDVRRLYDFLCQRWHYQLDNSDLDDREIERLRGIIELSSHGEITVNLKDPNKPDSRLITFEPENDSGALQVKTNTPSTPGDMLEVGNYRGFRSRLNGRGRRLSEGITATLLWALSMAPYSSLYRQRDKLSARSLCPAWCMVGHYINRPSDGMKETLWLGWPIPDWESPFLWMQMDKCWRICLTKSASSKHWENRVNSKIEEDRSAFLVVNFIRAVLYVSKCQFNHDFKPMQLDAQTAKNDLDSLRDDMNGLFELYKEPLLPQRQIDQAYWMLCRFPLLSSSESGIHSSIANQIFDLWEELLDKSKIDQMAVFSQIQEQRTRRIAVAISKLAPGFDKGTTESPQNKILLDLSQKIATTNMDYKFNQKFQIEEPTKSPSGSNANTASGTD